MLDKTIFRDIALATIATWALVRIVAGRHNKVLSVNECEKCFELIHSKNSLWPDYWGSPRILYFRYSTDNGLNGQETPRLLNDGRTPEVGRYLRGE